LALALSSIAVLASTAGSDVPATFLPPPTDALRRVLETPVSGDFRSEPARQVFHSLFRQLPANLVFGSTKQTEPTFTGKFDHVPFRIALFQVAQATGYKVEWTARPD